MGSLASNLLDTVEPSHLPGPHTTVAQITDLTRGLRPIANAVKMSLGGVFTKERVFEARPEVSVQLSAGDHHVIN